MIDKDIPVVKEGNEGRNIGIGCAVIVFTVIAIPVIIVAIPLVAGLYRWGFGG